MNTLTENEKKQIEVGIEIAFMHLRELIKHPEKIEQIPDDVEFFPVYLKEEGREAVLFGIKPKVKM